MTFYTSRANMMLNFYNTIISPHIYLTVCFMLYALMALLRLLSGYTLLHSFLSFGIFLVLLLGIVYRIRFACKILAVLHVIYVLFGLFLLSSLIYHAGTTDILGYNLNTVSSTALILSINLYIFLGAIRLWRNRLE
jgi:hypothetical protein